MAAIVLAVGVSIALFACSTEHASIAVEMDIDPVGLTPIEREAIGPIDEPGHPIDLYHAVDIASAGDSILVAESGNARIVILDSTLHLVRALGHRGAGPDEFSSPVAVHTDGGGFVVAEMGNNRFTWMTHDGGQTRTALANGAPMSFGVLSNGDLIVPGRSATVELGRIAADATVSFALRPDTLEGDAATRALVGTTDPQIAVTAGDTIHTFDQASGEMRKWDPAGRLVMRRALPAAMLDSIRERNRRTRAAFAKQGLHSLGSPIAKSLKATDDGRLVLLVTSNGTAGFIIDVRTYLARPIVVSENDSVGAALLRSTTALLRASRLIALQGDSIIVFRLGAVSR
jgi:hypothetical protein